ncbi:general substrate transporter [Aspergillus sclerotiicarbonarius CBS 121057]|uniref:General substrate transporter n=1 Tax=Aspergillus sclerotiicarbonarius (strain CBS 121057 / IBT 28362) TaxID=1448318 RepID=A0A319EGL4_ASPSB|nr:general substrate transporter [Aspergillus sclerotiicarbonarius CBS 121057]
MPTNEPRLYLLQVLLITAPAFILYGYNQAGLSALLSTPAVARRFPTIDTVFTSGSQEERNSTSKGAINACFQLGALLGSLSCSYLGDSWGRRRTILLAAILALLGQVLQASAFSLAQLVVGRVMLGLGVGQLSVMVPVWQSESAKSGNRGQQVITTGIFICVGFSLTSWINFGCSKAPYGALQWRLPLALPVIFSLAIAASIMAFPESPRWLVLRGRTHDAVQALGTLKGLAWNDPRILSELDEIERSLEAARNSSARTLPRLRNDHSRLWWRFTLCMVLQFFQQTCGGNLISIYTTEIFEQNLGLSGDLPQILAAASLTWKLACSFIAFAAIDRLGRRVLFIISGMGMTICMVVMAVATSFPTTNKPASIGAATFIFIFNLCYPIGFLGGNFLYCTEIAPAHLRASMASVSTANHWLWNFVVTMIIPLALSTIGWRFYIVFASISACIPLVVYFFFPETSGCSLEAIDRVFKDAPTVSAIVPMARGLPHHEPSPASIEHSHEKDDGQEHREWA